MEGACNMSANADAATGVPAGDPRTQWLRTDSRRTNGVSVAGSDADGRPPHRGRCVDCPLIFFTAVVVARVACANRGQRARSHRHDAAAAAASGSNGLKSKRRGGLFSLLPHYPHGNRISRSEAVHISKTNFR